MLSEPLVDAGFDDSKNKTSFIENKITACICETRYKIPIFIANVYVKETKIKLMKSSQVNFSLSCRDH